MAKVKKVIPQVEVEESQEEISGPVRGENGDKHYDSSTRSKWGDEAPSIHVQMNMIRDRTTARKARGKSETKDE